MKKALSICLCLFLSSTLATYAQKADSLKVSIQKNAEALGHGGNNELKLNLLFTVLGIPEISYERIVQDNMGLGISVLVGLDKSINYQLGVTPHFRLYFGQKKANGFFIEANSSILKHRNELHHHYDAVYDYGYVPAKVERNFTTFGLGAAAGGKFLTRNGFMGEAYLGVGRMFGDQSHYSGEAYPRMGITLGKRF
jgi:hypothetical protein